MGTAPAVAPRGASKPGYAVTATRSRHRRSRSCDRRGGVCIRFATTPPGAHATPHGEGTSSTKPSTKEKVVSGLVVLLLVLALVFGGVGLFVEGLMWLLIIALVLLVVGLFTGARGRARA